METEQLLHLKNSLKEKFSKIIFIEEGHQYFVNDVCYDSVSSVIASYTPDFDVEKFSKRVAKREKSSQKEIKQIWAIRRDLSMVRGTEFHLYVETYLNEKKKIAITTPIELEIKAFHEFWDNKNCNRYHVVATELIIYDEELKIAGTIDCILYEKEKKEFYIVDWKTNKEIKKQNKYEKLFPPFDKLDNCNFNKYAIQTSIYRKIIEKNFDIKIANSYIIHFPPLKKNLKKENYVPIQIPYHEKFVEEVFEERRKVLKELKFKK